MAETEQPSNLHAILLPIVRALWKAPTCTFGDREDPLLLRKVHRGMSSNRGFLHKECVEAASISLEGPTAWFSTWAPSYVHIWHCFHSVTILILYTVTFAHTPHFQTMRCFMGSLIQDSVSWDVFSENTWWCKVFGFLNTYIQAECKVRV